MPWQQVTRPEKQSWQRRRHAGIWLVVALQAAPMGLPLAPMGLPIANAQSPAAPLSSAAIDPSIYREGEVRRFSSIHGDWRVVCDEVTRLKQRFCSLRSLIMGNDGGLAAELTISTGQDGRPAALLKMRETLARGGLAIGVPATASATATQVPGKTAPPVKPKTAATALTRGEMRLKPVRCEHGICTLIWTLKHEQIAALDDGRGLQLSAVAGQHPPGVAKQQPATPEKTVLIVRAVGFKEAVAVSLKPFE